MRRAIRGAPNSSQPFFTFGYSSKAMVVRPSPFSDSAGRPATTVEVATTAIYQMVLLQSKTNIK
ncbi:MAG: hypothetical protein HW390_876 [Candidatus Brocadiaceae bacterium]|nr:hypothetical protein [Candidatus Brocadiaceae bacterium]